MWPNLDGLLPKSNYQTNLNLNHQIRKFDYNFSVSYTLEKNDKFLKAPKNQFVKQPIEL